MNATDATLTELATAHSASTVHNHAPNVPANGRFGLIIAAAADSALSSAAPGTLTISATGRTTISRPWPRQIRHPAFDAACRWGTQRHRPPTTAAVMRRRGGNPC